MAENPSSQHLECSEVFNPPSVHDQEHASRYTYDTQHLQLSRILASGNCRKNVFRRDNQRCMNISKPQPDSPSATLNKVEVCLGPEEQSCGSSRAPVSVRTCRSFLANSCLRLHHGRVWQNPIRPCQPVRVPVFGWTLLHLRTQQIKGPVSHSVSRSPNPLPANRVCLWAYQAFQVGNKHKLRWG